MVVLITLVVWVLLVTLFCVALAALTVAAELRAPPKGRRLKPLQKLTRL